jgi:hypothetical protein
MASKHSPKDPRVNRGGALRTGNTMSGFDRYLQPYGAGGVSEARETNDAATTMNRRQADKEAAHVAVCRKKRARWHE